MANQPFDSNRYLRALERSEHAYLTDELEKLIDLLGYDPKTHRFMNAALFQAVMGITPSQFLHFIDILPISTIAVDHLKEEALAILNIVIEDAIKQLEGTTVLPERQMAILLKSIASKAITEWEQGKSIDFIPDQHVGEKFTLVQARLYIIQHAAEYDALPGKDNMHDYRTYHTQS